MGQRALMGLLQLGLPCPVVPAEMSSQAAGWGLFFGRYLGPGRSVAWDKRGAALPLGMVKDGKVS